MKCFSLAYVPGCEFLIDFLCKSNQQPESLRVLSYHQTYSVLRFDLCASLPRTMEAAFLLQPIFTGPAHPGPNCCPSFLLSAVLGASSSCGPASLAQCSVLLAIRYPTVLAFHIASGLSTHRRALPVQSLDQGGRKSERNFVWQSVS